MGTVPRSPPQAAGCSAPTCAHTCLDITLSLFTRVLALHLLENKSGRMHDLPVAGSLTSILTATPLPNPPRGIITSCRDRGVSAEMTRHTAQGHRKRRSGSEPRSTCSHAWIRGEASGNHGTTGLRARRMCGCLGATPSPCPQAPEHAEPQPHSLALLRALAVGAAGSPRVPGSAALGSAFRGTERPGEQDTLTEAGGRGCHGG